MKLTTKNQNRPLDTEHTVKIKRNTETANLDKGYMLGKKAGFLGSNLYLTDNAMLKHILIAGDVGCGATDAVARLLVQQTAMNRGWVHFDMRGDWQLHARLEATASRLGREDELHVLDLYEPRHSDNFDIFAEGSSVQKARRLLHLLSRDSQRHVDGQEFQMAQDILAFVIAVVGASGNSTNIGELSRLLPVLLGEKPNRRILDAIPLLHPERASLERVFQVIFSAPLGKSQLIQGLNENLQKLKKTWELAILTSSAPGVQISDVLAHNRMLYVRLPGLQDEHSLAFYHAILQACLDSVEVRSNTPRRTRLPFIITIPDSADGISIGGSYNMVQGLALDVSRTLGVAYVGVGEPEIECKNSQALHAPTLRSFAYTKLHFNSGRPGQFTLASPYSTTEGRLY